MSVLRPRFHLLTCLLLLGAALPSVEVYNLQLYDAGPNGLPVQVEGDIGGPTAIAIPQWTFRWGIGSLTPELASGSLLRSGNALSGQVSATIRNGNGVTGSTDYAVAVSVQGQIDAHGIISGTWTATGGGGNGILSGRVHELPALSTYDRISLTMDCPYPSTNSQHWNQPGTFQPDRQRIGFYGHFNGGTISNAIVRNFRPAASWMPGAPLANHSRSIDPLGRPFSVVAGGEIPQSGVQGGLQGDGTITATVTGLYQQGGHDLNTTWTVTLQRAGSLWFGMWTWAVHSPTATVAPRSGRAVARLGRADLERVLAPPAGDRRQRLLHHALALSQHPATALFHDPMITVSAINYTGDKQYDNIPYNVAAAVYAGLIMQRLSDDPDLRHSGLHMARNAAAWYTQTAGGGLPTIYKGMSWMHAWSQEGLAALARHDGSVQLWQNRANHTT